MEKPARAKRKFIFGLLTFFCELVFFAPQLHAKNYATYEYVRTLSFKKADEYFFTSSECTYYLDIKYVSPDNVTVYVNSLPSHVTLVSCKKEVLLPDPDTDDDPGTHVIMKLSFSQPGTYRINSVDVIVKGAYYRLPFERVEVMENPRYLLPQLSINFDDNHKIGLHNEVTVLKGEHLKFTLGIKYAVQVTNVSWIVPEDSLFKEIESYEASDAFAVRQEFSPQELPLVSFDWQPLKEGTYTFPKISVVASSYSGSLTELALPDIKFRVLKTPSFLEQPLDEKNAAYAYAFDERNDEYVSLSSDMDVQSVRRLYELRTKERHSLSFFNGSTKERMELESAYSLENIEDETSLPFTFILCTLSALLFLCVILLFVFKKFFAATIVSVFSAVSIVFSVVVLFSCFTRHAVFKGGELSAVPEANVTASAVLKPGSLVIIQKSAAGWFYISHNETYGWVPSYAVYEIK